MSDDLTAWRQAVENRSLRVGIIGLGYVGLPLALLFPEAGFPVLGFDIDPEKVAALNAGRSYIQRIPAEQIADVKVLQTVVGGRVVYEREGFTAR